MMHLLTGTLRVPEQQQVTRPYTMAVPERRRVLLVLAASDSHYQSTLDAVYVYVVP